MQSGTERGSISCSALNENVQIFPPHAERGRQKNRIKLTITFPKHWNWSNPLFLKLSHSVDTLSIVNTANSFFVL